MRGLKVALAQAKGASVIANRLRPPCLKCGEPINTKYTELPHGWLHPKCEGEAACTVEALWDRSNALYEPQEYRYAEG